MIKMHELERPNSCLNKADKYEPLFVLRAQDRLAPLVTRLWANLAEFYGCNDDKIKEALALADQMEKWTNKKFPD